MVHTPKQLYSTARCWSAKRSPAAPSAADFADVTTCRLQLVRPHLTGAGARGAHIGSAECGHLGAAACRDGRSARRRHGAMPVSPLLISCPCPDGAAILADRATLTVPIRNAGTPVRARGGATCLRSAIHQGLLPARVGESVLRRKVNDPPRERCPLSVRINMLIADTPLLEGIFLVLRLSNNKDGREMCDFAHQKRNKVQRRHG